MTDWIANAEAGSSVRSKLNSLTIPIASGAIASPVEYFDVALPSGYFKFLIQFADFKLSTVNHMSVAASYDGGTTFAADVTNFDTYGLTQILFAGPDGNTTGLSGGTFFNDDSLMNVGLSYSDTLDGEIEIFPGGASSMFRMQTWTQESGVLSTVPQRAIDIMAFFLNPGAVVTPSNGRANLLRFLPYGNGDCNPPTSGNTITSCSWALFGIPTPA